MGNRSYAARLHRLGVLCAVIILLGIALHLVADVTCGSPYLINARQNTAKNVGLLNTTCHLLDSLALPIIILMLVPELAIVLLAQPHPAHWYWSPPSLVPPPLYVS